jgi:hypothetical protein
LDVHLEMNEICENFRYACGIPTVKCGVYEGKCRTCLYWPPDVDQTLPTHTTHPFLENLYAVDPPQTRPMAEEMPEILRTRKRSTKQTHTTTRTETVYALLYGTIAKCKWEKLWVHI